MNFKNNIVKAYKIFDEKQVLSLASSVAFYTILSLTPFLLLFFTVLFYLGWSNLDAIQEQLISALGPSASLIVEAIGGRLKADSGGFKFGVFGLFTILLSASGIISELKDSLEFILHNKEKIDTHKEIKQNNFTVWLKTKIFAVTALAFCVFILTVSLFFSTFLNFLFSTEWAILWYGVSFTFSLIFFSVVFFVMFHYLPHPNTSWSFSFKSGLLCSVFFHIGKLALELYFKNSSIETSYGALSSFIVLLLWAYYNGLIILGSACLSKVFFYDKKNQLPE